MKKASSRSNVSLRMFRGSVAYSSTADCDVFKRVLAAFQGLSCRVAQWFLLYPPGDRLSQEERSGMHSTKSGTFRCLRSIRCSAAFSILEDLTPRTHNSRKPCWKRHRSC